jgi:molybdenum cofactor biosynthesis enzyme MoaA
MIEKNYERSDYSFANINLLGKCNLDCLFCLGKDLENEFSKHNQLNTPITKLKNLDGFLRLCVEKKVENIYITGQNTDPLLYLHLGKLIDYLQEDWKFKVGLRTNALLAKQKIDVINKCKEEVGYTLLTLNSETMKKITNRSFIPNFAYLFKNTKPPQRVATVFTKYNAEEIFDLIKFVSNYPQVRYFQIRRISTETRYESLKEHIELFDKFLLDVKSKFEQVGSFELAPKFKIYGVETLFWKTVETSINSLNYFSNGVVSDEYFIIEGYKKNVKK